MRSAQRVCRGLWTAGRIGVSVSLVALPTSLLAQSVGGGGLLQSYTFDDPDAAGLETIQLVTLPFAVTVPIGTRFGIDVAGAYASGSATSPMGTEATLSGLTDTHVGVNLAVPGADWVIVSARASLPTGQSTHTAAESLVAGVVAAELLPFGIQTWGSGGNAGANVALVRQFGGWGVGFAGGYAVASEYEPLEDQELGYRPGDQMQASIALDHDVGRSGTFSVLLGFQSFGNDQLGGADLFQSGNRIQAIASYAFAVGRSSSALIYGGVNQRQKGSLLTAGTSLGDATDAPTQQLFTLGTNIRMGLGRRVALLPNLEGRAFRAGDGASQGWVTSGGTTLEYRLTGGPSGRRLVVAPSGKFRVGRVIVSDGVETGLIGWEAGLTLRAIIGR